MDDIDSDACTWAQKGENEQHYHGFECGDLGRSTLSFIAPHFIMSLNSCFMACHLCKQTVFTSSFLKRHCSTTNWRTSA